MCLLFISEQGVVVKRESRRIYAEKEDTEILELQTRKISAIAVMGNVQITTQALALLAEVGIPVTYLGLDGTVKGEFMPPQNKNMYVRYSQYIAAALSEIDINIARYFVCKKIGSYIHFLRKIQKNEAIDTMHAVYKKAVRMRN